MGQYCSGNMGLDVVEMVLAVEETFGISIPDGEAAQMITPALLIAHVQGAVVSQSRRKPCMSQRAFHRVRANICEVTGLARRKIKLDTRIRLLFLKESRGEKWDAYRRLADLPHLPDLRFGRGAIFEPCLVKDLVRREVMKMAEALRSGDDWTDQEVRVVVRDIISEELGIQKFDDHDEFVRDLGAD